MQECVISVCCSDVLAVQSNALDYVYQIHNTAANIAFAQQMAVSHFRTLHRRMSSLAVVQSSKNMKCIITFGHNHILYNFAI